MKTKNTRRLRLIAFTLIILAILAAGLYYGKDFLMELWWYTSLDLASYFLLRETYHIAAIAVLVLLLAAMVFANLHIAGKIQQAATGIAAPDGSELPGRQRSLLNRLFHFASPLQNMLVSLLLALVLVLPLYPAWEDFLLYFASSPAGIQDPAYGKDISYYLFSYPVHRLLQRELLLVFILLLVVLAIFYRREQRKSSEHKDALPLPGKIHLTALILAILFIEAWGIYLERIGLLYESRHEPVFFGPGFVEMRYGLPLLWLKFISFLGAGLTGVFYLHHRKGAGYIAAFGAAFLLFTGLKNLPLLPELLEEYYVKSNPVAAEQRYMQYNINATLHAFGLNRLEKIEYPLLSSLTLEVNAEISEELHNIPVWDNDLLSNVYQQLQAIRPFYRFDDIAVDRYTLNGRESQVNIAARELAFGKLPAEAQTWNNRHLIYTHGYGAVITPSDQQAGKPMRWLLKNITLDTAHESLKITRPEIYYGLADYSYAIVPNSAPSSFGKTTADDLISTYQGSGGLKLSSLLHKLVVSAYLGDSDIFFSTAITSQSRILVRRNIRERIHAITPFLQLDANPYPVILDGKIYWIVDAYTTSTRYPLVKPVTAPFDAEDSENQVSDQINYVRNSVKIIVDAYHGKVDYYIVDHQDPVIDTYRRLYPTLFKDISRMPKGFIRHLNYPRALFTLQMQIYSRYHQQRPEVFYQQSDTLEFPEQGGEAITPYYLLLDPLEKPTVSDSEYQSFLLVSPMSPVGRENLRLIAVAGCFDNERCRETFSNNIQIYHFPRDIQVEGPAQISGIMDQNPEISRQLTLWNQRGSKVIRGKMIIVPVERSLLYIQPLYLSATSATGFPQLARIVVVMNRQAVMDTSLSGAFRQLQKKLQPAAQ